MQPFLFDKQTAAFAGQLTPGQVDRTRNVPRALVNFHFATVFLGGAGVQELGRAGFGGVVHRGTDGGADVWGEATSFGCHRSVEHFAALLLPVVVEQIHNMDVVTSQIFQNPGVHRGVASVRAVVQHGNHVVAHASGGEGCGQFLRRAQAALFVLQLLQGDADGTPQVAHQITHGRPGIYNQIPRPSSGSNVFLDPIGRYEGCHQPIASKSVETCVGLTTDWVTGEPSTASRQISRSVSSSASART